jgi:hypothetical protein
MWPAAIHTLFSWLQKKKGKDSPSVTTARTVLLHVLTREGVDRCTGIPKQMMHQWSPSRCGCQGPHLERAGHRPKWNPMAAGAGLPEKRSVDYGGPARCLVSSHNSLR